MRRALLRNRRQSGYPAPAPAGVASDARPSLSGRQCCAVKLGVELAAGIPGARFLGLPGRNHILQDGDPAIEPLAAAVKEFVAENTSE